VSLITDRASIKLEFFRLCNTDIADDDMIEHDGTAGDGMYELLENGMKDTQLFLIACGLGELFSATTSALSFTGSDPDKYTAMPEDFLRLNGSREKSALRYGTNTRWGKEIPQTQRFSHFGNFYYIRGFSTSVGIRRLYLVTGAAPPSDLVADYYYRHATLADSTTVDIPEDDRDLIPAFAARRAIAYSWFPGDAAVKQDIKDHLRFVKGQTWQRSRHSRQPKMATVRPVVGDRWIV